MLRPFADRECPPDGHTVTGWEGIDADPEVTRDYTARAVAAITAWRK